MSVLTAAMVTQRTRQPIAEVRKLNLWSHGLSDVSVLSAAENLQILCLSSNQIKTLQNFPVCPVLTQLILRNNQIADLEQVQHLAKLPKLHLLWLAENPIERHPQYAEKVLAALPALIQLDDNDVSEPALRLRLTSRPPARPQPPPQSFPDLDEPSSDDSPPPAPPHPKPAGRTQKLAGPPQKPADQITSPPQKPADQMTSPPQKPADQMTSPPQKPAGQMTSPPQKPAGQITSPPQKPAAVQVKSPPVKKLLDTKQLILRQSSEVPEPGSRRRIPRETEEHILSAVLGLLPELNLESLDQVIFRCMKLAES
jgi:hypothetical protein